MAASGSLRRFGCVAYVCIDVYTYVHIYTIYIHMYTHMYLVLPMMFLFVSAPQKVVKPKKVVILKRGTENQYFMHRVL